MTTSWQGVEGVILDAVGTLIEPAPGVAAAYRAAAARQGVDLDEGEVRRRFGRHFRDDDADDILGPMATSEAVEDRRWRRVVAQVLPELPDAERGFRELWGHFARPEAWRSFPDVVPALMLLEQAECAIVVASNFDGRLRPILAGLPELVEYAETVVISSEVGHRKPHPAFFVAACDRLNMPAEHVLAVGDDRANDVGGAEGAGLRAVLIDRGRAGVEEHAAYPDLATFARALIASRHG